MQDLCRHNFAGKKCVTKINSFSIIQEIYISCNKFANAFLISISKYLNWKLDVAWHSLLQLFCGKKKSFAQKLTFFNAIVSLLNNCLLKSRKLEILKCESLKSCVSKKRNPSSAQISVELCPWENHLCQKLFLRAAIIVEILCIFKCLVFHIKYISILIYQKKTLFFKVCRFRRD